MRFVWEKILIGYDGSSWNWRQPVQCRTLSGSLDSCFIAVITITIKILSSSLYHMRPNKLELESEKRVSLRAALLYELVNFRVEEFLRASNYR
jgi:hypothetical protein